jgi:hypothetical protein
MVAIWKRLWRRGQAPVRVLVTVPDDRLIDYREAADLRKLLAALALWEAGFVEDTSAAEKILAAANQRDAVADARDAAADQRDNDLDLAEMLDVDHPYGYDWPARREAAADREHAKQDRLAARLDRIALADPEGRRLNVAAGTPASRRVRFRRTTKPEPKPANGR